MTPRSPIVTLVAAAAVSAIAALPAAAQSDEARTCHLIRRGLAVERVQVLAIGERRLAFRDGGALREVDLDECVAVVDPAARDIAPEGPVLRLADGQRLPGEPAEKAADGDALAWSHPWIGRIEVPLNRVRSVRFAPVAGPVEPGDEDRLLLVNGDRLEGLVVGMGDPIALEVAVGGEPQVIEVPRDRVAALTMVTPDRPAVGRRVWFRDGTIVDARQLRVGDDGFVRIETAWPRPAGPGAALRLGDVAAVLFDASALVPLASLEPDRLEGGESRYHLPSPRRLAPDAPLGLSPIELSGPIVVRYALPAGTTRFAADAVIPHAARAWGDLGLVVRDDDRVVFEASLDGDAPTTPINVPLRGSELTIELTPGRHGPIQDRVVLEGAVIGTGG